MFDKRVMFFVLASVILASEAFPSIGAAERYPSSGVKAPDQLTQKEWTSIREQIRLAQYQFTWQTLEGKNPAYRAPNRAQGFDIAVAPSGFSASGKDWRFGLALTQYGSNKIKPSSDKENIRADKEKAECRKSRGACEWYRNTPEGVEHGFTLNAPPSPGAGKLVLAFAMDTNLLPSLAADGQTLILREPKTGGPVALRYDSLVVTDAAGRRLGSRMMLPAANRLELVIDAAGAVFPVTVDPLLHTEIAILHASDMQANDWFGYSVGISGDTLVVGAYSEDGGAGNPASYAGAAYVFTRNQGGADNWGQVKILRASDMQAGDEFGFSVSVSGETLVIGACNEDGGAGDPLSLAGAAYIFSRNEGGADNWGQVKVLHASDMQLGDQFGYSVSISGDTLAVGAYVENGGAGDPATDSGAAYVFSRNQGGADNWGQVKILHASDMQAFDRFGGSVSVSGETLVVGAANENGGAGNPTTMAGAAYVFSRNQGGADNWGEVKILHASDMQEIDLFGYSVSVSGDTLAVGAYTEDGGAGDPATSAGAAYLFSRNHGGADNWGEVKILHASDMQAGDEFGLSVSISGETLVIGACNEDGGAGDPLSLAGAAYVFSRNEGGADNWGEADIIRGSDTQAYDYFGNSVSVSGDTLVVGASGEDGGTGDPATGAGAAYIYQLSETCAAPSGLTNNTAADLDGCAGNGVRVAWSQDATDWGDGGSGTRTYDILRDAVAIQTGIVYGTTEYDDTTGVTGTSYTYSVRYNNGCGMNAATAGASAADADGTPSVPVITAVTDESPCTQGAITVTFTAGSPATRHDLYRDGSLVLSGVSSPVVYTPGDTASHSYVVRAVNIYETCFADSAAVSAADANDTPSAPTAGNSGPICAGATLNLTASTIPGAAYAWTGPNGFTSALQNPSIMNATTAATGTYSVTATVSGCTSPAGTTTATVNAVPSAPVITAVTDDSPCAQGVLTITFTAGSPATRHDLYRDGVLVVSGVSSPIGYNPGDTSSHSYLVRAVNINDTCFADSAAVSAADANGTPTQPVITGIIDVNLFSFGLVINYTPGSPATRHDLYRDGVLVVSGFVSGGTYNPMNNQSHSYSILAVNGSCSTMSSAVTAVDMGSRLVPRPRLPLEPIPFPR